MKKLKDPKATVPPFLKRAVLLKETLGPILFQLPPGWKCNQERLEEFLKYLPKKYKYTFELRNETWFNQGVYNTLREFNAAFCVYEINHRVSPLIVTADWMYVRLHGPGAAYQGSYSDDVLKDWARKFKGWRRHAKEIYCYFDNDQAAFAVQDARRLQAFVDQLQ